MAEPLRDTRWNLRIAGEADALVRQAATERRQNLTDFVIGAALIEAERVLADRTRFLLDDAAWAELAALLDQPVQPNPGLERLFSRPSVFADEA